MILERTFALLLIATLPVGALCCGMEAVATGDPSASSAPGAAGRAATGDAGGAALGKGDGATAPEAPTTVGVGVSTGSGSGAGADAGGLAICRLHGAACAVTTDCCSGLSCTGEDEDRRCK